MLWAMGVGPGVEQRQEGLRRPGPQTMLDGALAEAVGREGISYRRCSKWKVEEGGGMWRGAEEVLTH